MKEVNLSFETFHKIFRYIEDRLLNYSTLAYSKHERSIYEELKIAPQFTLNLQEAGCTKEELEFILNFLAFHNNDRSSPLGIFYQNVQYEYTVQTKTENIACMVENICFNADNTGKAKYPEFLQFISDISSDDAMTKVLRNPTLKGTMASEICGHNRKMEATRIKSLHKKETMEMQERHTQWDEDGEGEEIQEEKEWAEREAKLREEIRQEFLAKRRSGGKKRHADTPATITKIHVVKPMYANRELSRGNGTPQRAETISKNLTSYYERIYDVDALIASRNKVLDSPNIDNNWKNRTKEEINKFKIERVEAIEKMYKTMKDKINLVSEMAEKLIDYLREDRSTQIYRWCLKIDKGEL